MTRKKEVILQRIIEFYIDSSDFNGIPHWQLHAEVGGSIHDVNTLLEELLLERKINLNYTGNPYAVKYSEADPEVQVQTLRNWKMKEIEIYPARCCLEEVINKEYKGQPFSIMAFLGRSLFAPIYFEMEALEYYFENPDFIVEHGDYKGTIWRRGSKQAESNYPLLSTFGLGYKENNERVLAVYLQHLHKMSSRHQLRWQGFLVEEDCRVAYEYHQEVIMGEKVEYRSIFEAFLAELHHINQMSFIIFNRTLFRRDYVNIRHSDFKTIFRPTRENYLRFLKVLKEIMSDNINPEFFQDGKSEIGDAPESSTNLIGLFEKWLKSHIHIDHQEDFEVIFEPFYKVNTLNIDNEQQTHFADGYSKEIYTYQNQWMVECYNAVKMLRLIFANNPTVKDYEIPDWLLLGKVTIY